MKEDAQDAEFPRIIARGSVHVSPYVELIEKTVQFAADSAPELYHGVTGADYICVVAMTVDGKFPLVRQFRPIVERFTWELPAGTLEPGEHAEACALRELHEETGYASKDGGARRLQTYAADTGRLGMKVHGFYAPGLSLDPAWKPEKGVETGLFTMEELEGLIRSGEFCHSMHTAYLLEVGLIVSGLTMASLFSGNRKA